MRRLVLFSVAAAFAAGSGYVLAQAPAKKTSASGNTRPAEAAKTLQASVSTRVSTPPMPNPGFAAARPVDVTRAVYDFAAQHPEVLKYVPCYCGCESTGHPHNESCFVRTRDAKGNVTAWDTHGYGWQVCIDVARDAMLMHRSGADPVAIRSSIEKKWTPKYRTKTPTPNPPPKK